MLRHCLGVAIVFCLWSRCGANYCRDANLCCPGRDSSCVVQKLHQNAIIEDQTDKPCYCDHACLKLGDCCPDFKATCGVVDCVVSTWGQWSACNTRCGPGSMVRIRTVVQEPQHGGKHCPTLVQRRACHEHHGCSSNSEFPLRGEVAIVMPGSLSASRSSNRTLDIRKNLRLRNPDDPDSQSHREYCVQFQVVKSSKACHIDADSKSLREGETVKVKCERSAFKKDLDWRCSGHGAQGHVTRFLTLLTPHCHGKWIRSLEKTESVLEDCDNPDFVFV